MKNKLIRCATLLCAMLMLLGCFSACSKDKDKEPDTTAKEIDVSVDDVNSEAAQYLPKRFDLGGYTYRMLIDAGVQHDLFAPVDGMTGSIMDQAFYERNLLIEEYFNIEFQAVGLTGEQYQIKNMLVTNASVGEDFCDVFFAVASNIMQTAIVNGYAMDVNQVAGLNLETSYWDQRIQTDYQIEGKLFALEGDITVYDEMRTQQVTYNKKLYEDLGYLTEYGTPYAMVESGTWTLDTMLAMAKDTSDLNSGNGDLTKESQWGIISETPFLYAIYLGSGKKTIQSNEYGEMTFMFDDDSHYALSIDMFTKIGEKLALNEEILFVNTSNGVLSSDTSLMWKEAQAMFINNQALFRTSTLTDVLAYAAEMTTGFGILPVPRYSETQTEYYSVCAPQAHMPLMIPVTARKHIDKTAAITEAAAYFSRYIGDSKSTQTVVGAFYEVMAINKLCNSEDDYKMLELIFGNKTYDLDSAMLITYAQDKFKPYCRERNIDTIGSDFSSANCSMWKNTMNKYIADMWNNAP